MLHTSMKRCMKRWKNWLVNIPILPIDRNFCMQKLTSLLGTNVLVGDMFCILNVPACAKFVSVQAWNLCTHDPVSQLPFLVVKLWYSSMCWLFWDWRCKNNENKKYTKLKGLPLAGPSYDTFRYLLPEILKWVKNLAHNASKMDFNHLNRDRDYGKF